MAPFKKVLKLIVTYRLTIYHNVLLYTQSTNKRENIMLNADTNLIGTMQEFKESMYGYISDASKDAQGFRTRFDYTTYTAEELMKEAVYWEGRVVEAMEEDRIREAECVAEFEKLIAETISIGAADRETAIRWLRSGDDWTENDDNYFEYTYGLPYGYLSGKKIAWLA